MTNPSIEQGNHFVQVPNMIANTRFHCWRNAQRLMNPTEIVIHIMQRQHADCRAVARLWRVTDIAINLLQHRKINFAPERIFDRAQVSLVSVETR